MNRSAFLPIIGLIVLGGCASSGTVSLDKIGFESLATGKRVELSESKGRIIVLEFWATWCGPCHQIAPFVQELYNSNKDKDFVLVSITSEERELVEKFLENSRFNYPVGLDSDESVHRAFGVDKYPTMVILGRDGEVLFNDHPGKQKEVLDILSRALN